MGLSEGKGVKDELMVLCLGKRESHSGTDKIMEMLVIVRYEATELSFNWQLCLQRSERSGLETCLLSTKTLEKLMKMSEKEEQRSRTESEPLFIERGDKENWGNFGVREVREQ